MLENERKWSDCTDEEKLLIIEGYLEGMVALDDTNRQVNNQRLEWIREHIPAYNLDDGKNYIFVSYSHLDYKEVYKDLAVFSYNSQRRVRFWYDEGLPIGQNWEEAAGKIIKNPHCVGVLFYLSKNLLLSPSVYKEIECVKNSGKSYCQVALSDTLYSAAKIFDDAKGSELRGVRQHQDELEEFFPDNETALISYGKENAISRIEKIARQFDVTEEVFSDFVCEECEGGLSLIEYRGIKTEVHIPEKIGNKPILKITAEFPHAVSVFIPKTVFHINRDIFDSAINLEEITVDENNPKYYDINGVLCERDCVGYSDNKNEERNCDVILRAPISWDWKKQFTDYQNVKEVDFFKRLIRFTARGKVNLNGSEECLSSISKLFPDEMADDVTYDDNYLDKFKDLFNFILTYLEDKNIDLKKVANFIIHRKTKELYDVFKALKKFSVFFNIGELADNSFKNCRHIPYVFLPDNIYEIGRSSFENSNIILVFLPQELTVLSSYMFSNCKCLLSVLTETDYYGRHSERTFDKALLFGNIKFVYSNCFRNTVIRGVEFGNKLSMYWEACFAECIWLREVTVTGKTKILSNTFTRCLQLTKVILEEGVEELRRNCFSDCVCLKFVEIPKSVKFIEDNCFNSCDNLETINYGGTKDEWYALKMKHDEYSVAWNSDRRNIKIICNDGVIYTSSDYFDKLWDL